MNEIDAVVTKINSEPRQKYGFWLVDVEYNYQGKFSTDTFIFNTEKDALEFAPGFEFTC